MKDQFTYSIKKYSEIELAELAKLSVDVWNAKGNQYTVERYIDWLKNLEFDFEPKIVVAKKDKQLVGWVMLFVHSKTELELNPFALGGHPFIVTSANKETVANNLLKKVIDYFNNSNYTRIELTFDKEDSSDEQLFKKLYDLNQFTLFEQICHMRNDLTNSQEYLPQTNLKWEIKPISEVKEDDFLKCIYNVFKNTEDNWMQSLTDEEIKDNFETRVINRPFKLIEGSSLGLLDNDKLIGFSVVRESHGSKNGHLWLMGIHSDYRRQGLGSFLIDTMLDNLVKNDYETASLNVDLSNKPAYDIYKSKGFKEDWVKLCYVLKK